MPQTEREARVVALLEDSVRTELRIANGALNLGLSDASIENVMQMVTSSVLYAFEVDWSPDWVKDGEFHAWEEDGGWYARCPSCLSDSPRAEDRLGAVAWAKQHELSH